MNINPIILLKLPKTLVSFLRAINQYRLKGGIVNAKIYTINQQDLLNGKNILITGGSHGIGFAIAKKFIACGAKVVISGRHENDLEAATQAIASKNLNWLAWDAANIKLSESKLGEAEKLLDGEIDILINNAGVLINDPFLNVSESTWDKVYSVNSKGVFFLTQAICRRWLTQERRVRKVINISSTSGFLPGAYPYRMSKWDLVGMTRGLGLSLAASGIIVNGIAPGRTAGRMLGIDNSNICDSSVPVGRSALPEEIAELASFLAGDSSNYIVGQTIICDGGYTIYQPRS